MQEIEAEQNGKRFILHTLPTGVIGKVFHSIGAALPPNICEADRTSRAA